MHIDSLAVYPDAQSRKNNEPIAEIENLDIALDLQSPRRITRLAIESLHLYISTREESPSIAFLERVLASEDTETDVTWIPETVRVDSLWLVCQDEVGSVDVLGVELDAGVNDSGDVRNLQCLGNLHGNFNGSLLSS